MKPQRHVPLFVLCLFGVRVLACSDAPPESSQSLDAGGGASGAPDASVLTDVGTGGSGGTGTTGGSGGSTGGTGGQGTGGSVNTGGGNPTDGTGGMPDWGPVPPTCEYEQRDDGGHHILIYYARLADGGTELRRHECEGGGVCATSPPRCAAQFGAAPYQLCLSAGDCANMSYCQSAGAPSRIVLGSPDCVESVCDWKAKTPEPCPGNTTCIGTTCGGTAGTTSGGFPWGTGGGGGQGGAPNHD